MVDETHKTLEELENDIWPAPSERTSLIDRCHRLRKKPLGYFSPGDVRVMISQDIGAAFLMPLALALLRQDPMVCGDYYEGDLLMAALRVDADHFRSRPDWAADLAAACVRAVPAIESDPTFDAQDKSRMLEEIRAFLAQINSA